MIKVLVVDDEEAIREVLRMRLRAWGFEVDLAENAKEAKKLLKSFKPHLILSDVVMPELSGLELLAELGAGFQETPVVLMTAHGSVDMAVEAMKQGAYDFLTKPIDYSKLQTLLDAVTGEIRFREQSARVASKLEADYGFGDFVGTSRPMLRVYELIRDLSESSASVLICGESGTGKELVARTIHSLSQSRENDFVAINAAAIPHDLMESEIFGHERGAFTGATQVRAGCFELAHKGTLFLDEIAEMPMALQPKLLRVIEDGQVRRLGGKETFTFNVRILAATNVDPLQAIQKKLLRQDLYYRLNVFTVQLPPLRDRDEDIHLLTQHFIRFFNDKHRTNVEAVQHQVARLLRSYPWPGNVRELKNVVERAVILAKAGPIETSHLPPYLQQASEETEETLVLPMGISAAEAEKRLILRTLDRAGNNKAEAARQLGLDVKTIRNKLKSYGVNE